MQVVDRGVEKGDMHATHEYKKEYQRSIYDLINMSKVSTY